MLIDMRDMLLHAYRNRYAVGAFDLVSLDFLQAILNGAENCQAPVILSLAESHFAYFDFALLMPAVVAAARRSPVPVAIHFDHGMSLPAAIQAIGLGCNGVMVDTSNAPLEENIARSRAIVEMARGCGIPVEGELGYVAGVEGEDAALHPGTVTYTAPAEARRYVAETGVDFLAVSIGTVHGRMHGQPQLDIARLEQINAALGIPLVIHGGTGLSDAQFADLIAHGVAKINYYTALADAAGEAIRRNAQAQPNAGYTGLTRGVQDAIRAEVERCIRLWGGAGQAAEIIRHSRPWQPVDHVILYNATAGEADVCAMMEVGKQMLGAIPGVLEVSTGQAVAEGRYRYCWLIRFAHAAVIDSYRDHPAHLQFADTQFRPLAGDRVSIDFQNR